MTKIIFGIILGTFTIIGSVADIRNKHKLETIMIMCIMATTLIYIPLA